MDFPIRILRVDPTSRCNHKCRFCRFHGLEGSISRIEDLDFDAFCTTLDDLAQHIPNLDVRFVGSGEPSLHPCFDEMVLRAKGRGFTTHVITNGSTMKDKLELLAGFVDRLVVSLHGIGQLHDDIVGVSGSYDNVLTGLKELSSIPNRSAQLVTHTTLNDKNCLQIDEIAEFVKDKLGGKPEFLHLSFNNSAARRNDISLMKRCIREALSRYPDLQFWPSLSAEELDDYYDGRTYPRKVSSCRRMFDELNITRNGTVTLCGEEPFGSIFKSSVIEILESDKRLSLLRNWETFAASEVPSECRRCFVYYPRLGKPANLAGSAPSSV